MEARNDADVGGPGLSDVLASPVNWHCNSHVIYHMRQKSRSPNRAPQKK